MRQARLPLTDPMTVNGVAVADQDAGPVLDQLLRWRLVGIGGVLVQSGLQLFNASEKRLVLGFELHDSGAQKLVLSKELHEEHLNRLWRLLKELLRQGDLVEEIRVNVHGYSDIHFPEIV